MLEQLQYMFLNESYIKSGQRADLSERQNDNDNIK